MALFQDGAPVDIGGPNQKRLVASLVISPRRRARSDYMIDCIWGDDPPVDPLGALRTNVSRIRRVLGEAEVVLTGDEIIRTVDDGYELDLDGIAIDLDEFEHLTSEARGGEPTSSERLAMYERALLLCGGRPFGELADLDWLRADVARVDELRVGAWEQRLDLMIHQGRENEALAELAPLIADDPIREQLRILEMTALHKSGRTAEALRRFNEYRNFLVDEIGVEPGSALRDLEQRVLVHESEPTTAEALNRVRGYELIEQIGEGAYSVVWKATQPVLQRDVAIKQIRAELANDADFIRQFEAEAQMVASLEHPHIVPLFDYWREPDSAFLVMRYLRGGSLASLLAERQLTEDEAATLYRQVGSALETAHAGGVEHGDVHPRNIMLDGEGNFFLSDFGIARRSRGSTGDPAPPMSVGAGDVRGLQQTVFTALSGDEQPLRPESNGQSAEVHPELLLGLTESEPAVGPTRNPYKGLRAFREADASDFFGRTSVVEELLDRLRNTGSSGRLIAVVGPSGSGKSSVVSAGLLPQLRDGAVTGSDRWFITSMTPGGLPFEELESALHRVAPSASAGRLAVLTGGPTGLARVTKQMLDEDAELVLAIDQFEELFVSVRDVAVRDAFLDSLVEAVEDPKSRIRIVITIRADFWDRPLQYERFGRLIERSAVHLTAFTSTELEEAILRPAEGAGAQFEPGLVATLVADVRSEPGAMPLLQYTLRELFDRSRSGLMLRDDYDAMGGIVGALSAQAESVFTAVREAHGEDAVRRLFVRLIELGEGTEDTRRRAVLSEFNGSGTMYAVDRFGDARLLTFDRHPQTREPTVEVAHEALIREWPRLRGWVDAARDEIRTQRHITHAAEDWTRGGREESELYRGGRLDSALRVLAEKPNELSDLEREFVEAGATRRQVEEERRRAELRRLRRSLVAVAVAFVVAMAAGLLALVQRNRALDESDRATVARIDAEVARLAADASQVAETQPRLGLLLAAEAYARDPGVETLGALQRVLVRSESFMGALGAGRSYFDVAFTDDGEVLVARRLGALDAFDLETRQRVWSMPVNGEADITVALGIVAAAEESGGVALMAAGDGQMIREIDAGQVGTMIFGPAREILYTGDRSGWLRAWSVADGSLIGEIHAHAELNQADLPPELRITEADTHMPRDLPVGVRGVAIDEERGTILTTGGVFLRAWDLDSFEPLWEAPLRQPSFVDSSNLVSDRPGDVAIAGDRAVVVTRSLATIFDLDTGESLATVDPSPQSQTIVVDNGLHLAVGADGKALVADATGSASLIDVASAEVESLGSIAVRQRSGQANTPSVAIHPESNLAAFATSDGVRLRALDGSTLISALIPDLLEPLDEGGLGRHVTSSADGSMVVADDYFTPPNLFDVEGRRPVDFGRGSTIYFWLDHLGPAAWLDQTFTLRLADADFRVTHRVDVDSLAWAARSPDGNLLATGSFADDEHPSVVIHDLVTGSVVAELDQLNQPEGGNAAAASMTDLSWSPDGRLLVGASSTGAAVVWDTSTWDQVDPQIAPAGGRPIIAAAFTPDGENLLTVRDGLLTVRDAKTFQPTGAALPVSVGGEATLNTMRMAFSDDGRRLLTTFGNPLLIDTETWSTIGDPFPNDEVQLNATVGAKYVATGEGDSVRLWNLDTDRWLEITCLATGGGFSDEDWAEYGTDSTPVASCPQWIE